MENNEMIKRILVSAAAFGMGFILMPLTPIVLAVWAFQEYDSWEES